MILPQQQVVRGGGAGASLALGGDGGAPGRRHRSTGRETHFVNFCRLQRNRQPSLPPKTESLIGQKRVRIGASLPILSPYPYSDRKDLAFWLRAQGKRGRDQQIQKQEQMISAIEQGVLKALGGWVAYAGIAKGSEKAKRSSCSSTWAQ